MLSQSNTTTISALRRLTRRYVKSEADAARLAERALRMISDDPSLLDGPNVDKALFRLVHGIANEDFRGRSSMMDAGISSEGETG